MVTLLVTVLHDHSSGHCSGHSVTVLQGNCPGYYTVLVTDLVSVLVTVQVTVLHTPITLLYGHCPGQCPVTPVQCSCSLNYYGCWYGFGERQNVLKVGHVTKHFPLTGTRLLRQIYQCEPSIFIYFLQSPVRHCIVRNSCNNSAHVWQTRSRLYKAETVVRGRCAVQRWCPVLIRPGAFEPRGPWRGLVWPILLNLFRIYLLANLVPCDGRLALEHFLEVGVYRCDPHWQSGGRELVRATATP